MIFFFSYSWEATYHIAPERKSTLKQTTYNTMKPNSRSINYGYNPNDDYNETNSQRWFIYSDYYYRKGSVVFESIDDLFEKIKSTDLAKVQAEIESHNSKNRKLNTLGWRSIERYLGDTGKGEMPKTFSEGMELWNSKNKPPQFFPEENNEIHNTTAQHWVVVSKADISHSNIQAEMQNIYFYVTKQSKDNEQQMESSNSSPHSHIVLTERDLQHLKYRILQNDAYYRYPKYLPEVLYALSKGARQITLPGGKNLEYQEIWTAVIPSDLDQDDLTTTAISLAFCRYVLFAGPSGQL